MIASTADKVLPLHMADSDLILRNTFCFSHIARSSKVRSKPLLSSEVVTPYMWTHPHKLVQSISIQYPHQSLGSASSGCNMEEYPQKAEALRHLVLTASEPTG